MLKRAILLGMMASLLWTSIALAGPKEMTLTVTEPGESTEWTLGALNTDEADGLGRFFETLPKAENGDRLHTHRITWAFITWEKP